MCCLWGWGGGCGVVVLPFSRKMISHDTSVAEKQMPSHYPASNFRRFSTAVISALSLLEIAGTPSFVAAKCVFVCVLVARLLGHLTPCVCVCVCAGPRTEQTTQPRHPSPHDPFLPLLSDALVTFISEAGVPSTLRVAGDRVERGVCRRSRLQW